MRLRNIKGAEEAVLKSPYVPQNYKEYYGHWCDLFGNKNPIHLEIGMGKGNFLIENAVRYPEINFIGVEKYYSVLYKAVNRLENMNLPNLKIIPMDAEQIEEVFHKEIDTLYLNFSDPWPKNKHERRRLTSNEFLKRYDSLFQNKNHIQMKTDNRKLFEYSLLSCTNYGYKIEKISLHLHEDVGEENIQTEYEMKFSKQGYPIYFMDIQK